MGMSAQSVPPLRVATERLPLKTRGQGDIIDLTPEVSEALRRTGLREGQLTVFSGGSTGAVGAVEFEPGLVKDLGRLFERLAPRDGHYAHHATWGDDNGSGHVRATLQGPTLTVPFEESRLLLGTWQQIVFLEFDTRPRERRLILQFLGA